MEAMAIFGTFAGNVAAVVTVGEFVDKYWSLEGKAAWARIAVIGLGLSTIGAYMGAGYLGDWVAAGWSPLIVGLMNGAGSTLVANGVFSMDFVKTILERIKIRKRRW